MAYELVYTSAQEGLNRGSSGFCVVTCTKGLGQRLVITLEGLSAYKPLYPHYAPNAWDNPVAHSHYIYKENGESQHILSRICFNGVDYTQRSNKLASHLVLSAREALIAQGGPASLLLHEELFKDATWNIKAEYYSQQREIPATAAKMQKCSMWESVMGDAGWGGYLAQTYMDTPNRNIYIVYKPEQNKDILPLLQDAINLLPQELRWQLTFSTYFVNLPAGMSCTWRCCPVDSDALRAARRSPSNIIIDITKPAPLAQEGKLITIARTGIVQTEKRAPAVMGTAENLNRAVQVPQIKLPTFKPDKGISKATPPPKQNTERPSAHISVENDQEFSPTPNRKRAIITIITIICLLVCLLGCILFYSSIQQGKIREKNKRCEELFDNWENISSSFHVIPNKEKIQNEKEVDNYIKNLGNYISQIDKIIKEINENLLAYQTPIDQYQKQDSIAEDKTPQTLKDNCERLRSKLNNKVSELEKNRDEIKTRQTKRTERKKEAKMEVPSSKKNPDKKETIAKPATPVKQKTSEKEKKRIDLKVTDRRYLWINADKILGYKQILKFNSFNGPFEKREFKFCIGLFDISDISISADRSYKIGEKIECKEDSNTREAYIYTEYNKDKGELLFTLNPRKKAYKGSSVNNNIWVRVNGKKDFPLFFRLDLSKIKPQQKGVLKIDLNSSSWKVNFPASALIIPERFYTKNNRKCTPKYILKLKFNDSSNEKINLIVQEEEYCGKIEDSAIIALGKQKESLNEIEKEISNKIKEDHKEYYEIAKKILSGDDDINKWEEMNTQENLKKFVELLDKHRIYYKTEEQTNLESKIIRKKIKDKEKEIEIEKIAETEKEEIKQWQKQYDRLSDIPQWLLPKIFKSIPLKELGYEKYMRPLNDEKKSIEKSLKDIKAAHKKAIQNAVLYLIDEGEEYQQFELNELL